MAGMRSDQMIDAYREKYVAGEIEVWEFEEAVGRALTGAPSAAEEASALYASSLKPRPDPEWFRLAHERRIARWVEQNGPQEASLS